MFIKAKSWRLILTFALVGGFMAPGLFCQEYATLEERISAREKTLENAKAKIEQLDAQVRDAKKRMDEQKRIMDSYRKAAGDPDSVFVNYNIGKFLDSFITFVNRDALYNGILAKVLTRELEDKIKAGKESEFYDDPNAFDKANQVANQVFKELLERSDAWKQHFLKNEFALMGQVDAKFNSKVKDLIEERDKAKKQIAGLEADLVKLRAKLRAESDSCDDLSGVWINTTGNPACPTSTWTLIREGGASSHSYIATESGCGKAKGKATYTEKHLRIEWEASHICRGYYDWTLDPACQSGHGQVVMTGDNESCKGSFESTVKRQGVSSRIPVP